MSGATEWVLMTWLMIPGAVPLFDPLGPDERACRAHVAAMEAAARAQDGLSVSARIDQQTGLSVHHAIKAQTVFLCFERPAIASETRSSSRLDRPYMALLPGARNGEKK